MGDSADSESKLGSLSMLPLFASVLMLEDSLCSSIVVV